MLLQSKKEKQKWCVHTIGISDGAGSNDFANRTTAGTTKIATLLGSYL